MRTYVCELRGVEIDCKPNTKLLTGGAFYSCIASLIHNLSQPPGAHTRTSATIYSMSVERGGLTSIAKPDHYPVTKTPRLNRIAFGLQSVSPPPALYKNAQHSYRRVCGSCGGSRRIRRKTTHCLVHVSRPGSRAYATLNAMVCILGDIYCRHVARHSPSA